ncbi:alpha/beta hydrolase [Brevibacillus dissolubilis]|uniref:alpha/beta hydrolase n=1 Tax=Brevibacillus dissolubilis TaxID=1844116 RepID=UPI00210005DC|nr:alpha/beta hydrolase-fold protein [Brevibacillus dissolubilis]
MSGVDLLKGTLTEVTLESKYLGTSEQIVIYTPYRYSPLYSYPVLYVQDGSDYLAMGRLASLLDQFATDKEIPDLIAVFLPVDKAQRSKRYHPNGSMHAAYTRFLAEEVVNYIDRHYSTNPLGSARTLIGDSLGGVVSLFTALTYPNTFGQVASQSGAFDDALCEMVENQAALAHLNVYLEIGLEETAVETSRGDLDLVHGNERMRDILLTKGITLAYRTFEGDHTWGYWQANLPLILRHLYAG